MPVVPKRRSALSGVAVGELFGLGVVRDAEVDEEVDLEFFVRPRAATKIRTMIVTTAPPKTVVNEGVVAVTGSSAVCGG